MQNYKLQVEGELPTKDAKSRIHKQELNLKYAMTVKYDNEKYGVGYTTSLCISNKNEVDENGNPCNKYVLYTLSNIGNKDIDTIRILYFYTSDDIKTVKDKWCDFIKTHALLTGATFRLVDSDEEMKRVKEFLKRGRNE